MAYYGKKLRYTQENAPPIMLGGGVNTSSPTAFNIDKSEAYSSLNTTSTKFPALSVRAGYTVLYGTDVAALTAEYASGVRGGTQYHVQDNTVWKYWNGSAFANLATGLTAAQGKILEFNITAKRYTILVNGTEKKYWDGSSVADITDGPATNLYTVDDNRLYALKGSVLYSCALELLTDWTTVDDADENPLVGMLGDGVAISKYSDMVICWSDQTMHIVYGDDPLNTTKTEPIPNGCVSDRSVITYDGILYFMDYFKIMAFTGGLPIEISQKVREYLNNINYTYKAGICAGQWGRYLYWSIPYGSTATANNLILQYDIENKTWYPWNFGVTNFVKIGEDLIAIKTDGEIIKLHDGTTDGGTAIASEHTTGIWDAIPVKNKKADSAYYVSALVPVGSTLTIAYSTTVTGDDFVTLKTFTPSATEQTAKIMIPTDKLHNFNYKRLKFSGTGPYDIYYIEEKKRVRVN